MTARATRIAVAAALLCASSTARADSATDKKRQRLAAMAEAEARPPDPKARARLDRQLDRRIGKPPPRLVDVYNGWTLEHLAARADYQRDPLPQPVIDRFLRCHYTNQATDIDPRLFPALIAAAVHFHVGRVFVISGHRSPKYNLILRKKGHEVSRNSQHVLGKAVDFRLPGVSTAALRDWASRRHMGGVGYYPRSGFIHIDTARVRHWSGR